MAMSMINQTTFPSCGEETHCSLPSSIKTSYCGLAPHNATEYVMEKKIYADISTKYVRTLARIAQIL